jgi:hypothetical protein
MPDSRYTGVANLLAPENCTLLERMVQAGATPVTWIGFASAPTSRGNSNS